MTKRPTLHIALGLDADPLFNWTLFGLDRGDDHRTPPPGSTVFPLLIHPSPRVPRESADSRPDSASRFRSGSRDALDYLVRFPIDRVGEIHLAGHSRQALNVQEWLLIDDHATPVPQSAWQLLREATARGGPRPVLIEWDRNLPAWQVLAAEVAKARSIMDDTRPMDAKRIARA